MVSPIPGENRGARIAGAIYSADDRHNVSAVRRCRCEFPLRAGDSEAHEGFGLLPFVDVDPQVTDHASDDFPPVCALPNPERCQQKSHFSSTFIRFDDAVPVWYTYAGQMAGELWARLRQPIGGANE